MTIAFFDFDGTISNADSFLAFTRYANGRRAFWQGMIALSPQIVLFGLKRYPNWRLKEKVFGHFFRDQKEADLLRTGEQFSADRLPMICRPEMLARMEWHRQQRHELVVLTASSPIWLGSWCLAQGATCIGTGFEVRDGRYTGKLDGQNCHGQRKREIVAEILAANPYAETYGYGDSRHDAGFLSLLNKVNTIGRK